MARRPTRSQRRIFAALIAKLQPELRAAFEAGAADLHEGVVWRDLIAALERGDVEAAVAALRIEPSAYSAFAQAKTSAYAQGAAAATAILPTVGGMPGIRFNMQNPAAEAWIRRNVGERIVEIAAEQIEAARETILTGYQAGRHPTAIARDIAGRVSGGTRQGGVLGLDPERARRLSVVSRGMETAEGVQDLVVRHRDGSLSVRYQVNPATRNRILKAYRNGGAVSPADRAISERQYSNALLKSRADTIARTETGQAVMSSRYESWQQFMQGRNIPPEAVIKTWVHGGGVKDPRPHHVAASGKQVRGLETPFILENGASLQYPLDPNASADEVINCTCTVEIRVDQTWVPG